MLLWFAVLAPVLVAEIFRSPLVDYRLVALGALLPLADLVWGHPSVLHTLAAPVVSLTITMLATVGRRLLRRRLLGISIGMFFHLILGGAWSDSVIFWWPIGGGSLADQPLPETTGLGVRLLLEAVAVGVAIWAYSRYGLSDPRVRRRLISEGHLTRAALS